MATEFICLGYKAKQFAHFCLLQPQKLHPTVMCIVARVADRPSAHAIPKLGHACTSRLWFTTCAFITVYFFPSAPAPIEQKTRALRSQTYLVPTANLKQNPHMKTNLLIIMSCKTKTPLVFVQFVCYTTPPWLSHVCLRPAFYYKNPPRKPCFWACMI